MLALFMGSVTPMIGPLVPEPEPKAMAVVASELFAEVELLPPNPLLELLPNPELESPKPELLLPKPELLFPKPELLLPKPELDDPTELLLPNPELAPNPELLPPPKPLAALLNPELDPLLDPPKLLSLPELSPSPVEPSGA